MLRHNVFISAVLTASGQFTRTITCPFAPDEVKVKMVAFYGGGDSPIAQVLSVHAPMLTSDAKVPLCTVIDPCQSHFGVTFPMNHRPDGSIDFKVADQDGDVPAEVDDAHLTIYLEFRKH